MSAPSFFFSQPFFAEIDITQNGVSLQSTWLNSPACVPHLLPAWPAGPRGQLESQPQHCATLLGCNPRTAQQQCCSDFRCKAQHCVGTVGKIAPSSSAKYSKIFQKSSWLIDFLKSFFFWSLEKSHQSFCWSDTTQCIWKARTPWVPSMLAWRSASWVS